MAKPSSQFNSEKDFKEVQALIAQGTAVVRMVSAELHPENVPFFLRTGRPFKYKGYYGLLATEFQTLADPRNNRALFDDNGNFIYRNINDDRGTKTGRSYINKSTGVLHEREIEDAKPVVQQKPVVENPNVSEYSGTPKPVRREGHRGLPKNTRFTKKRPCTVLRSDAKTRTYDDRNYNDFGFLMDLNELHTKGELHIHPENGYTNLAYWRGEGAHLRHNSIGIKALLDKNKQLVDSGAKPTLHNECLFGLSRESIKGLFARIKDESTLGARLTFLNGYLLGRKIFNEYKHELHVPLFFYDEKGGVEHYSNEKIKQDLNEGLKEFLTHHGKPTGINTARGEAFKQIIVKLFDLKSKDEADNQISSMQQKGSPVDQIMAALTGEANAECWLNNTVRSTLAAFQAKGQALAEKYKKQFSEIIQKGKIVLDEFNSHIESCGRSLQAMHNVTHDETCKSIDDEYSKNHREVNIKLQAITDLCSKSFTIIQNNYKSERLKLAIEMKQGFEALTVECKRRDQEFKNKELVDEDMKRLHAGMTGVLTTVTQIETQALTDIGAKIKDKDEAVRRNTQLERDWERAKENAEDYFKNAGTFVRPSEILHKLKTNNPFLQ